MSNSSEQLKSAMDAVFASMANLRSILCMRHGALELDQSYLDAVPGLVKLIEAGIFATNAFELLLKVSPRDAQGVLFRHYLGEHLDPDTRYGSYQSNLSIMLSDAVDYHGREWLRSLLLDARVSSTKLTDSRVILALADALDLDDITIQIFIREIMALRGAEHHNS